jgi:putative transposase
MANPFLNGKFYHCLNLGIDKRLVFMDKKDLDRFSDLLNFYRFKNPPSRFSFRKREAYQKNGNSSTPDVEVIVYLMMPDHFHLILKQLSNGGLSTFLSKVSNSYTKYFNAKYKRSGPLFKGTFKSAPVEQADLLTLASIIHMEPVKKGIVSNIGNFPFSSHQEYQGLNKEGFCNTEEIMKNFSNTADYQNFLLKNNHDAAVFKDILFE